MTDRELLSSAYPVLKAMCEQRRERAIVAALAAPKDGTLTGDRAIHLWMEVNVVTGLLRSIETKIKLNETVEIVNG